MTFSMRRTILGGFGSGLIPLATFAAPTIRGTQDAGQNLNALFSEGSGLADNEFPDVAKPETDTRRENRRAGLVVHDEATQAQPAAPRRSTS